MPNILIFVTMLALISLRFQSRGHKCSKCFFVMRQHTKEFHADMFKSRSLIK